MSFAGSKDTKKHTPLMRLFVWDLYQIGLKKMGYFFSLLHLIEAGFSKKSSSA